MSVSYYDCLRIVSAANGTISTINPADDFSTTVIGGTSLFGGGTLAFQGGAWLWQNHGNYGTAFKELMKNPTPKLLRQQGNWFTNPFTNSYYWKNLQELDGKIIKKPVWNQKAFDALKTDEEKTAFKNKHAQLYKKGYHYQAARQELERVKELAKRGKLSGKELKSALKNVRQMAYKADLAVLEDIKSGKLKPTGKLAKIGNTINKYTGMQAAERACLKTITSETASTTSKLAAKAGRSFIKGGGPLTFAIELGLEIPDVVKTYNELGTSKGTKQLLKTTATAGASAVGFVAGAKAGAAVGTAIGACFGGVGAIPGAIIGTICGIGGGLLGSWLCRAGAKAVVGPSELEKAKKAKTGNDAMALVLNKDKQLETCADLAIKANTGEIELDNETIESMEKMLQGREEEFEKLVASKMPQEKNTNSEKNLSLTA